MAAILPPATTPDAATLARPGAARAWEAARKFEAMALGQFLAPMFESVDRTGSPFGGGAGERVWRPMLVQQMAERIAAQGGLGLAMPVFTEMLRMQEQAGQEPA